MRSPTREECHGCRKAAAAAPANPKRYKFITAYLPPKDPVHFKRHYEDVHVPLGSHPLIERRYYTFDVGSLNEHGQPANSSVFCHFEAEYKNQTARFVRAAIAAGKASFEAIEVKVVEVPPTYVAGEETAAINFINNSLALPLAKPPRPGQPGVNSEPTLVNNVETFTRDGARTPFVRLVRAPHPGRFLCA